MAATNGEIEYGVNYFLKVTKFRDSKKPTDTQEINWGFSFYDHSKNKYLFKKIPYRGDIIPFQLTDKWPSNSCGQEVDVYGREIIFHSYYNDDPNLEAVFLVNVMHRFKFFDRSQFETEVWARTNSPWLFDQNDTSLCGIAAVFFIWAKHDWVGYKAFMFELHRKGFAKHNDKLIRPTSSYYKMDPNNNSLYPSSNGTQMPFSDWIGLASVRNTYNSWYNGHSISKLGNLQQAKENVIAINFPGLMEELGKELLGFSTSERSIYSYTKNYIREHDDIINKIRILNEEIFAGFSQGSEFILMIDASMVSRISNTAREAFTIGDLQEYHWVVFDGDYFLRDSTGIETSDYSKVASITFRVFTWGGTRTINLSPKAFARNYYGYVKYSN